MFYNSVFSKRDRIIIRPDCCKNHDSVNMGRSNFYSADVNYSAQRIDKKSTAPSMLINTFVTAMGKMARLESEILRQEPATRPAFSRKAVVASETDMERA